MGEPRTETRELTNREKWLASRTWSAVYHELRDEGVADDHATARADLVRIALEGWLRVEDEARSLSREGLPIDLRALLDSTRPDSDIVPMTMGELRFALSSPPDLALSEGRLANAMREAFHAENWSVQSAIRGKEPPMSWERVASAVLAALSSPPDPSLSREGLREAHVLLWPPHPGNYYGSSALCSCGRFQYDQSSVAELFAAQTDVRREHVAHVAAALSSPPDPALSDGLREQIEAIPTHDYPSALHRTADQFKADLLAALSSPAQEQGAETGLSIDTETRHLREQERQ